MNVTATLPAQTGWDITCWILLAGVVVAGGGLYLAYRQLTHLSNQLRILRQSTIASFLFEIDRKFDDIYESRKLARVLTEKIEKKIGTKDWEDERLTKQFTITLETLRRKKPDDYYSLMKLPDFCETIGYLMELEYISGEDIKNLWGPAIRSYVKWFRTHIEDRQTQEGTDLYEHFLNKCAKLQ